MKILICAAARAEELLPALRDAGLTPDARIITAGSIPPSSDVEWVGLPPSPDGGTFDLHAPIEGADDEPRWIQYSWHGHPTGWNYTRDLMAFFPGDGAQ